MITSASVDSSLGVPRVRIETDSVGQVYRVDDQGREIRIRNSYPDSPAGVVYDYEVPQGTVLVYLHRGQGELNPQPVEVGVMPILRETWLVPCQAPEMAAHAFPAGDGVSEWTYAEQRDQLDIPGGYPFVVSTRSRAKSGSLTVICLEAEDKDKMEACLLSSGSFFVSVSPRFWPWRGITYIDISAPKATPVGQVRIENWRFDFSAVEVLRPMVPAVRPHGWASMPETWAAMPTTWPEMPQ